MRNNEQLGNQELIKLGGQPIAEDFACFKSSQAVAKVQEPAINDLFAIPNSTVNTPEKTVTHINPIEIFNQQTKGAYIETQAEVDAYLKALKEELQAALEQQQRIAMG